MDLGPDLVEAIRSGNLARLAGVLDRAAIAQARTPSGWHQGYSLLHYAAEHGQLEIARWLIEQGAPLDARAGDGSSALVVAARAEHLEVLRVLIDAGANLELCHRPSAQTALALAIDQHKHGAARLLVERGASLTAVDAAQRSLLHLAAETGSLWLTQQLLAAGLDPSAENLLGDQPLHSALENQHVDVAAELIRRGADFQRPNRRRWTPLYSAAGFSAELVILLLELGANTRARPKDGRTALHRAVWREKLEIAAGLLARTDLLNEQDQEGKSALGLAAERGLAPLVSLLLERGADPSVATTTNWTPLHAAAWEGHTAVLALLVAGGASVNARQYNGSTSLYCAARQGHASAVELLLQAGADPMITSHESGEELTALEIARDNGHEESSRLLSAASVGREPSTPDQGLWHGPKLRDGLAQVLALLRPLSSVEDLDAAAAILESRRDLHPALTRRELARLERSPTPATQTLFWTMTERLRGRSHSAATCPKCGRPTVYTSGPNVLHGNPLTPASDTEVEWEESCASCDWEETRIV